MPEQPAAPLRSSELLSTTGTQALIRTESLKGAPWQALPATGAADGVAVFRVCVASFEPFLGKLYALLNTTERSRASRYHQPAHRQAFIIRRGVLRCLLSRYLQVAPEDIDFSLGLHKKPFVENAPDLHFNVSHSREWALVAIAPFPIGIDIEYIGDLDYQSLAEHSFSPIEQKHLATATDPRQTFYQLWARKEATLKALSLGLNEAMTLLTCLAGARLELETTEPRHAAWAICDLLANDGYASACAFGGDFTATQVQLYHVDASLLNTV